MSRPLQPRLLDVPIAALARIDVDEANELLVAWGHRLGPVHRPFGMQAFVLGLPEPVAVAVSASTVSNTAAGYRRGELVELARLGRAPAAPWALRVMLRLWRELCGPRWPYWRPLAAISYSKNADHSGDLYRFDGWERAADNCGVTGGGGAWSRPRYSTDPAKGPKSLWRWRYVRD